MQQTYYYIYIIEWLLLFRQEHFAENLFLFMGPTDAIKDTRIMPSLRQILS